MTDLAQLKTRFENTLRRLGATGDIHHAFTTMIEDYQHPPRFYHTIDHVADVLAHLDFASQHADELKQIPASDRQNFIDMIELAIWYHDVVYDATRHDNEALSADNMTTAAQALGIPEDIIHKAQGAILITAHHADAKTLAEKIIVDCDLHVLGIDWDKFANNSSLIRREYAHVPDDAYVQGRAKGLATFITPDGIYKTDAFRARYEQKAVENIRRLIDDAAAPRKNPSPTFKK